MSIERLVVKGQTKISLHDRFTDLRKQTPAFQTAPPTVVRPFVPRGTSYDSYLRSDVPRSWFETDRSVRRVDPDRKRRAMTVDAALRIKKRSLKQRIGKHTRIGFQPYTPPYGRTPYRNNYSYGFRLYSRGGRGGRYFRRRRSRDWMDDGMRRWGSTDSVESNFDARRGGDNFWSNSGMSWGSTNSLGGNRRGWWRWRSPRGFSTGWGWKRGGYRGRGRRREPLPKKEDLDKELDEYMAGCKSLLDKELDEYMSEDVRTTVIE